MKIKKLVASIVFTGLVLVGLMGCKQSTDPQTPSDVDLIKSLSIENGALDIDPAEVSYFDIKFSKAMDKNYYIFMCYNYGAIDVNRTIWMNSFILRVYVDLRYSTDYIFVINESEAVGNVEGYTRDKFIRDTDGNLQQEYRIEFRTKDSPNRVNNQSITHNIDLNVDYTIQLVDNSQYNPGTQQAVVSIKDFLNHEYVKTGDKVNLTYKITSAYDLKNIKMNLVDNSAAANNWKALSTEQVFIDQLDANTEKTGTISFDITADMARGFSVQFWTTYKDNPELIAIDILKK